MGIQYDSVNNQVVFSGDTYVKRYGAGAVQLGNTSNGLVASDHALFAAISAPATPSSSQGRLFANGTTADIYWLNSGGVAVSLTQSQTFSVLQGEPTGLPNRTDSTLSFNNTSREFTIAPAVTSFDVYSKGTKYTKSIAQTVTLTDVTGLHYVYFDASGVLQKATSTWDLGAGISPVATVYWNTDLDQGRIGEERHGLVMDWATHEYIHESIGSRYVSGLGGSFTNTTFTITDGVYRDEDIRHVPGEQTQCRVFRRDGSGNWTWGSKGTLYYVVQNTHLTYDNGGTLTETNSNNYVAVWFFVTNDPETPIYVIMGQRKDGNIADARNNNTYDQLVLTNLPAKEFKVLYRVILRDDASPYEEAQDLRSLAAVSSGTYIATDHNSLTNRTVLGSHPASAITVDAGAFTGFLTGTTSGQTAFATLDTHTHAPPSGDTRIIYNDTGAWAVSTIYQLKASGYTGIGQAAPGERLHLKDGSGNGAIVLGAHQNATAIAGTVEWTGTLLRWYDGSNWKNIGIDLTDPLLYKGVIDCSGNPNYPAADAGHTYRISVAGKIGGASGPAVEISDMMICTVDSSASGDHATVGANWDIIQANVDGVVIGPASSTDTAVALFSGTTGKLIKNSLVTIDSSGSVNIPSGQSYKINGSALTYANVGAEPTLPLSTRGDLLYRNASNVTARLPVGTNEQVITTNGTDVSWGAVPGRHDAVTLASSATTGGLGLSTQHISFQAATTGQNGYLTSTDWNTFNGKVSGAAGTTGQIQFNSSNAFAADSNLVWDNTNKRLGVGVSPNFALHVSSTVGSTAYLINADTATTIGGAAAVLNVRNSDTTTNNFNAIVFNSSGVSAVGGLYMQNTDHTNHYGKFQLVIRGADGWLSRVMVDNDGRMGLGNSVASSANAKLTFGTYYDIPGTNLASAIRIYESGTIVYGMGVTGGTFNICANQATGKMDFYAGTANDSPSFRMRISAAGYVGIGTLVSAQPLYRLHVAEDATSYGGAMIDSHSATDYGVWVHLRRSGGTQASPAAVPAGHRFGSICFSGYYNATQWTYGAVIQSIAYGLWSATNFGTCLQFFTTAQDTTALTERMRLSDVGKLGIANTTPAALLTLGTAGTTAGSLSLAGATSGVVTVQVAAAAGTWSLTLPTTAGTDGYFLKTNGSGVTTWAAAGGGTPAGSNSYVQFNNSSAFGADDSFRWDNSGKQLILGKVGQLGKMQFTGSTSGVVTVQVAATAGTWSLTLPADDGTSGQFLRTDGNGVCTWVTQSYNADSFGVGTETTDTTCFPIFVTTATGNQAAKLNSYLLYNSSTGLLTLGASGASKTGLLGLAGATSGLVTLTTAAVAGTWTMTLPTTGGTNGYYLQTNGSGVTTWAAAGGGTPAGGDTYVQFNNGGAFGGASQLLWDETNKRLTVGNATLASISTLHVECGHDHATLGSELVTNGSFTGGTTGWTLGTNWAYGTDAAVLTNSGSSGTLSQSITLEADTYYYLAWTQKHSIAFNAYIYPTLGSEYGQLATSRNANTQYMNTTFYSASAGSVALVFNVSDALNTGTVTIDDVSLKKITKATSVATFMQSAKATMTMNDSDCLGFGSESLRCLMISYSSNTGWGASALSRLVVGSNNTAFGALALSSLSNGSGNIAIGAETLRYLTSNASANIMIGALSGKYLSSGTSNIVLGQNSLANSKYCNDNIFIGGGIASAATFSGSTNVGVGNNAFSSLTTGFDNFAFGGYALHSLTTGYRNTAVGYAAGRYATSGSVANQTSTLSLYMGYSSRSSADGNTNEVVIGANAVGNGSNTTTIGHTDVTKIYLRGDIYSNTAYAKAVGGTNRAAYVDNTGLIGTISSSIRTKQDVVDMEDIGWIDRLRPVNFCYRSTPGVKQYGLIAEEVEGVNRDLVGYDWEGLPDSVTYDRLVPVLLKAVRELRHEMSQMKLAMLP